MGNYLDKVESIYKNTLGAADFRLNGQMTPEQVKAWVTHMQDKSDLLKKVNVVTRQRLTGATGMIAQNDEAFTWIEEGKEPVDTQIHKKKTTPYIMKEVLFAESVGYSVIDDNPEEGLVQKINDALAQSFSNSLQNLAINGRSENFYDPAILPANKGFMDLNEGFLQLATKAGNTTINKLILAANDTALNPAVVGPPAIPASIKDFDDVISRLVGKLPQEFRMGALVLMSDDDRLYRNNYLTNTVAGANRALAIAAMTAEAKQVIGDRAVYCPYFWPRDKLLLTKPENLEISLGANVVRTVVDYPDRRALRFFYRAFVDFNIVVNEEAAVAYIA